jgi:hypothetical protein
MAQASYHRTTDEEIKRRVRWWRFKRWATSREVWLTFVALLIACAFMVGRAFAAEPCPQVFGDSARPLVSQERFAECKAQALQEHGLLKVWAGLVVLLAVLSAIGAIHWMDRHMPEWLGEPKDEGRVLPPRGRW